jgi:large subunit ribosomal protein L9
MRALAEEEKQAQRRGQKEQKSSENLAKELEKVSITLQMKVGEDEKLFGAVTSQMIADALKEKQLEIDKRIIELEEPIKALGIYDVPVKLHQNVTAKVKVWVVRE